MKLVLALDAVSLVKLASTPRLKTYPVASSSVAQAPNHLPVTIIWYLLSLSVQFPMLNYRNPRTRLSAPVNSFAPLSLIHHSSKLNGHSSTSLPHAVMIPRHVLCKGHSADN